VRTLLIFLAILVALGAPAQAEEEPWSYSVWRETMSPFCPGRTLADCPSSQADSLRLWIQMQEAAGRSREDVEAELVERYGDVVLGAPRAQGLGIAAYAVPLAAFLVGGVGLALFLRRHTRRSGGPPGPAASGSRAPPAADPDLERLVDEELRRGDPTP
jgi:cytochrome c-type biogenesis protein CcmH/NrfF